jgi:hypothetical protein
LVKQKKKYLDLASLNQQETKTNFVTAAVKYLQTIPIDTSSNNEINTRLVNALNTAGNDTIPLKEKEQITQPWHDDETLKELYTERDKLKKINNDKKTMVATTRKIRKRARFL